MPKNECRPHPLGRKKSVPADFGRRTWYEKKNEVSAFLLFGYINATLPA
jgi:hypothetical protein